MLHHIVLFRIDAACNANAVMALQAAFAALPSQIAEIRSLHGGIDISEENRQHGFNHGWILTFDHRRHLNHYLTHPAHQAFASMAGQVVSDVLVFDFED